MQGVQKYIVKLWTVCLILVASTEMVRANDTGFGYVGGKIGILKAPDFMKDAFKDDQSMSYGAEGFYLQKLNEKNIAIGVSASYTAAQFDAKVLDATAKYRFTGIGFIVGNIDTKSSSKKVAYYVGYERFSVSFDLDDNDDRDHMDFSMSEDGGDGNGFVAGLYMADKGHLGMGLGFRYIAMEGGSDNQTYELFFSVGVAF